MNDAAAKKFTRLLCYLIRRNCCTEISKPWFRSGIAYHNTLTYTEE